MHTNTSFSRKADFAYIVWLVRSKRLVPMNTSFAFKLDFAYVYSLCARSGLCVRIQILRGEWIFFNVSMNHST